MTHSRPPVFTLELIGKLNKHLKNIDRPHFAIYYELLAYPDILATKLRGLRLKDIDFEGNKVLGHKVLPSTIIRLRNYCTANLKTTPNSKLFNFSKQRAHLIWLDCLEHLGLPPKTSVKDYKKAFARFLVTYKFQTEGDE